MKLFRNILIAFTKRGNIWLGAANGPNLAAPRQPDFAKPELVLYVEPSCIAFTASSTVLTAVTHGSCLPPLIDWSSCRRFPHASPITATGARGMIPCEPNSRIIDSSSRVPVLPGRTMNPSPSSTSFAARCPRNDVQPACSPRIVGLVPLHIAHREVYNADCESWGMTDRPESGDHAAPPVPDNWRSLHHCS